MNLEAVIFDFDGLMLDTEWPIYEMAAATFAAYEVELAVEDWAQVVGLSDAERDWFDQLRDELGFTIDKAEFDAAYRAQDRSYRDVLQPLPGVTELVHDLSAAGVPLAVASSSSIGWLDGHLARVGLRPHFVELVGVDHHRVGGRGKPDPAVYRVASAGLGADPARSVALEDSAHGVASARSAGLEVVAVPNRITRFSTFEQATRVVASLEEVTVDELDALVAGDPG